MTEPTDDRARPWLRAGTPRDANAAAALARYDARAPIPLVLSAILPLVVAPQPGNPVSLIIGVMSWTVFVIDFVVHQRLLRGYLGTRLGKFDLAIVLLTAPWFLLPGAVSGGGVIVLLRLARLARLVVASKRGRQLFDRIGRVALVALSVMASGAVVAYYAEHPLNPGFATFGDSLWWSVVTLTTVGYGDIVPETTTGRIAAIMIMLTGVAVLGLLAGTLASFFRLQPPPPSRESTEDLGTVSTPATSITPDAGSTSPSVLDQVLTQLTELRTQVAELSELGAQVAELTELRTQVAELTGLNAQLALLTAHLGSTGIQPADATKPADAPTAKGHGA